MKHSKAIVTIAIGDDYIQSWKRLCEQNWREYGDRHGYDVICIDQPLDDSERAQNRSAAWQKCLILSQDFSQDYERIVWLDTDILINTATAPCVAVGVPIEKVGAVEMWSEPSAEWYSQALARLYQHWGAVTVVNRNARDYYTTYGLPDGFDKVVQTAVMVFSPRHHRPLLERVYYNYEDKPGREWHMEMRPLSYELLKADVVHWLDHHFNVNWIDYRIMYYPFLLNVESGHTGLDRIKRKIVNLSEKAPIAPHVKSACVTTALINSHFLHFGGSVLSDMEAAHTDAVSWRECRL